MPINYPTELGGRKLTAVTFVGGYAEFTFYPSRLMVFTEMLEEIEEEDVWDWDDESGD